MKGRIFGRTVACTLSVILLAVSIIPLAASATNPVSALDDNDTPEEGARQFDEGVRDVERVLSLDLSTEKGINQAAEILKRNEKKLAKFEKKALQAALRVEAFKKGLKSEAAKRKGGDAELANELESKPATVGSIPGAEEAAEAIKRSTRPAADVLQRVSDALKKGGDALKAKSGNRHHATMKTFETELESVESSATTPNPQLFCGSYQYICDLLTRLGLFYLRRQIAILRAGTRKANCVVNAYVTYGTCVVTRPWDAAFCISRLSANVSNCLLFA